MRLNGGINGFGRMGRLALRAAWGDPKMEIVGGTHPGQDDQRHVAMGHRLDVGPMPLAGDTVDAHRYRRIPGLLERADSSDACRVLVARLHGVFEVEDHQVGRQVARFLDGSRVGCGQEQDRADGGQVDAHADFAFTTRESVASYGKHHAGE